MHLRAALTHLHLVVQPLIQPQRISSRHDFDASGRVVHCGCHPVVYFHQPQCDGLGNSEFGIMALFQQFAGSLLVLCVVLMLPAL